MSCIRHTEGGRAEVSEVLLQEPEADRVLSVHFDAAAQVVEVGPHVAAPIRPPLGIHLFRSLYIYNSIYSKLYGISYNNISSYHAKIYVDMHNNTFYHHVYDSVFQLYQKRMLRPGACELPDVTSAVDALSHHEGVHLPEALEAPVKCIFMSCDSYDTIYNIGNIVYHKVKTYNVIRGCDIMIK